MNKFFTSLFLIQNHQKSVRVSEIQFPNKLEKAPTDRVKNILDFAKSYRVLSSEKNGKFEMNLN